MRLFFLVRLPARNAFFTHLINLPTNEAGHVLFRIFGEFIEIAGGSLLQIIVSIVFFFYFIRHKKPFSASFVETLITVAAEVGAFFYATLNQEIVSEIEL